MPRKSKAGRTAPARNPRRRRADPANQARSVVTRSPHRKVGEINKRWFQQEPIQHESNLEKSFVQSSMLCLGLEHITSQPVTYEFEDGERYTPDFELKFCFNQRAIVEIKLEAKVGKYTRTFNKAADTCRRLGKLFFVVTEKNVHYMQRAAVSQRLLRYGKSELSQERLLQIVAAAPATPMPAEELMARTDACEEEILHLLARRVLVAAEDGFVASTTLVRAAPDIDPILAFQERFQVLPWSEAVPSEEPPRSRRTGLRKRPAGGLPIAQADVRHLLETKEARIVGGLQTRLAVNEECYSIRKVRALADEKGEH